VSVFVKRFQDIEDVQRVLQGLREHCGVEGRIVFKVEPISFMLRKNAYVVSREGKEMEQVIK
jgi:hypothetical protein